MTPTDNATRFAPVRVIRGQVYRVDLGERISTGARIHSLARRACIGFETLYRCRISIGQAIHFGAEFFSFASRPNRP